ncbi:unnamed protein product [Rotaria sordida]|uniref:C2H2-type domain-containing protein n=2 Tax=Rotaria sordida TaxID=392033 RepID=A0A815SCX0_9BILA|nr:unnamed protein product [Rotaria sordida]
MATVDREYSTLLPLTDCIYFTNGNCMFKKKCRYRHCQTAVKQLEECSNWPHTCRNIDCPYRHTRKPSKIQKSMLREKDFVSFFWDIENVPIPKGQKPFDIVQRIRQKLVVESGLQEAAFSCFCDINTISQGNQQSLHHANVRIIHVPDRKPGAVDRQIMLELDRFERVHRPPATIVLISGDIDFVGKLNDLRHQAGFHVIVIHNKFAKDELKATVNAHYLWDLFTESLQQQQQQQQQQQRNPENRSINLQVESNDQLNNNTKINQIPSPKLRQSRLTTKFTLYDDNNLRQNDNFYSKPPTTYRRFRSASRNYHSKNRGRSSEPRRYEPVNQTPIFNVGINTPSSTSNLMVVPRARIRQASSTNRQNQQNISRLPSYERISSTVNNDTTKKERNQMSCPYCTYEFSTIQALRQHQKDKKHLFYCSICNDAFPTLHGLKQHQTAKEHDISKNIDNQDKLQTNTNDNSNVRGLIIKFEDKLNMYNENKRLRIDQISVMNKLTIDRNLNNVNEKN